MDETLLVPEAGVWETSTVGVSVEGRVGSIVKVGTAVGGILVGAIVEVGWLIGMAAGAQAVRRKKTMMSCFMSSNYMSVKLQPPSPAAIAS